MNGITKKQQELLDEILKDGMTQEQMFGQHGLLKSLQKRAIESLLEGEMNSHLGHTAHASEGRNSGNSRNGKTKKTVKTSTEQIDISIPRDRNGSFEPQLIPKGVRRLPELDEKVIALYAQGSSTRDIQAFLEELYGVEVSPTLISEITDTVKGDMIAWQTRSLSRVYPVIYFDALIVKTRQDGVVKNRAVHLALGINMNGEKELLGMWVTENEGAKFWLSVFTELKNRGVEDCFVACVDGLKGLPEAIEAAFPKAQVQLCIVHKIRNSLKYVPWSDRKQVAADLRSIYGAATLQEAEQALERFSEVWGAKYPAIYPSWKADWVRLTVFFDFPPDIRKVLYTTNAIESLSYSLRKVMKNRNAFPNDEAALKLMYLGIKNISKKWTMPIRNWKQALNQFVIMYGVERVDILN